MAKNKKKKRASSVEQLRQQKLRQSQFINLFEEKLQYICSVIGDASLYNLIPPTELMVMYMWRGVPPKIEAEKGHPITKSRLETFDYVIKRNLRERTIKLVSGSKQTISLYDYFIVGMPMEKVLLSKSCTFPGKERFNKFTKGAENRQMEYFKELFDTCYSTCYTLDHFSEHYLHTFRLDFDVKPFHKNTEANGKQQIPFGLNSDPATEMSYRVCPKITLSTLPLDVKEVTLEEGTSWVVQVGGVSYNKKNSEILPYTLKPESLQIPNNTYTQPIPVYIHPHAFERLGERTGCRTESYCMKEVRSAIERPAITPLSDKHFLMEYWMFGLKIGYLVAELVDDIFLIRTFRLLTHSNTPEGEKLDQLTRLQPEDKKRLQIDKLSPLVSSDILSDEAVCRIFREAGCGPLLSFCEKMQNGHPLARYWINEEDDPTTLPLSHQIKDYLKPDAAAE
ncbi:MAG: hypothetical protein LBR26_02900 [Prevotella sp.]|jgi:hypothetical protein|nr:hypothetical protein [Prevotella sp.]